MRGRVRRTLYRDSKQSRILSFAALLQPGSDQSQSLAYANRCYERDEWLRQPRRKQAEGLVYPEGTRTENKLARWHPLAKRFILTMPNRAWTLKRSVFRMVNSVRTPMAFFRYSHAFLSSSCGTRLLITRNRWEIANTTLILAHHPDPSYGSREY